MKKRELIARHAFSVLSALMLLSAVAFGQASSKVVKAKGYLSVDSVRPGDKFKLAVAIEIDPGYHINANKPSLDYLIATTVDIEPARGFQFAEARYPEPEMARFEFSPDADLAVHEGTVYVTADAEADNSITPGDATIRAKVTVQSCNDTQCLAPSDLVVEIPVKVVAAGQTVSEANAEVFSQAASLAVFGGGEPQDSLSRQIAEQGMVVVLLGIFLAGLGLNLTPCVYPIIPITVGFFVNQSASEGKPQLRRTFMMASMYVIGMAITYSALGVAASLSKGLFGAALQSPVVLIFLAAVMIALALSMFGLYEFKVPDFLNRFATQSTQATSGIVGALVMGLTMGVVAAPCIGPFVIALLVHVGAVGSPVYGFFLFFVLSLGLGLPYLVLGTFSGAINSLPRSGMWMVTVKKVFGLVLVAMALYFLMPLMGRFANYIFVVFSAFSAIYLIVWESRHTRPKSFAWALRAIGVVVLALSVIIILPKDTEAEIAWQPYSEQLLARAREEGRGVVIDVYADWCVPCKELDRFTFTDSEVKREAERFVRLKLDLTHGNDPKSEAGRAKEKLGIRGVPTVIFVGGDGREVADLRLEGFEKPGPFVERLKKVEFTPRLAESNGEAPGGGAPIDLAPAVSIKLLDGNEVDLQSLRGKVVLIDFWATWCVPCISEIPMFNDLNTEYRDKGLEIVAISLDEEGAEKVKPFLKKHKTNYTQALGDYDFASKFGLEVASLPIALMIDKQGRIRYTHVGVTKREVFESEIKQLLGE
jgi:thiol:disulfide interchange protein DsbD